MSGRPIFIIGTARSGSNLLRLVLNAHSAIAIPHPPHIMRYFAPLERGYGDLYDARRFEALVDDVLWLLRVHIHPWELPIDKQRVLERARPRDVFGVQCALYDQLLQAAGKRRWGCKSTFMVHHVDRALQRDPEASFVLLVRDPRDVAASSRRSVFSPCHPWPTARLWQEQQQLGLALLGRLGPERVHLLRYEDLLADPQGSVEALCGFLGEAYEAEMLAFHRGDEARRSASLSESWQNTARPVIAGNSGKYRSELSPAEVRLVESITGRFMRRLDYPLEFPEATQAAQLPSDTTLLSYRAHDLAGRAKVEWRSLRRDANHWRRWSRDATMEYLALRDRLRSLVGGS